MYDKDGIQLDIVKEIKEVRRGRIKEYVDEVPTAVYTEGRGIWSIPCDIALPCATQNELNLEDAQTLLANGCFAVAEGANMPSTRAATDLFVEKKILFMPGKAACVYDRTMAELLHLAAGFLALDENGGVLLRGIVDEYEVKLTAAGLTVTICGRGYSPLIISSAFSSLIICQPTS